MAKKKPDKSWVEEARELQERILARRGGVLVPDSTPFIRACREGICEVCGRDIVDVIREKEDRMDKPPTSVDFIRASRDGLCPDHLTLTEAEVIQMKENKAPRKVRVSRPSRVPKKSWLDEAREVRKSILEARGGIPIPKEPEVITEIREEDD
jgi:hypothetical protein